MNSANIEKELVLSASSVTPLEVSAIQAASPIVLAFAECDEELRVEALEPFQASTGRVDDAESDLPASEEDGNAIRSGSGSCS